MKKVTTAFFVLTFISSIAFAGDLNASLDTWLTYNNTQKTELVETIFKAQGVNTSQLSPENAILNIDAMSKSVNPALLKNMKCGDLIKNMVNIVETDMQGWKESTSGD